ncbi:ead/Ea22-like family protein [Enterobacter hormaechei]|uniref:ead/Ea22-like family protein n=1 Tax=Enterobacter hormaechei TaxID=158836 RepID=UPI00123B98DA|nr:ead/Ea22-like family protein [Enterobacter hormaechei]EJK8586067.1 ead/Ea22-like family protein [Enterobacter hormaechei]EKT9838613.1 ead/Ea22-like family protein [Enterobacter hormaechei]ELD3414691.1 ead/Ea22-like family protein [Enterobacter hormaechei]
MSNIDKRALREAADAANKSSWGRWESYHPHKGARGYEVKVGVKAVAQHCLKVDSVFIAAANPATVLALLDELEAAEKLIAELELKLEAADKLQDSAFRHGLQHGFSYGQTDNQAEFEQAIQAYGQQWKGERA